MDGKAGGDLRFEKNTPRAAHSSRVAYCRSSFRASSSCGLSSNQLLLWQESMSVSDCDRKQRRPIDIPLCRCPVVGRHVPILICVEGRRRWWWTLLDVERALVKCCLDCAWRVLNSFQGPFFVCKFPLCCGCCSYTLCPSQPFLPFLSFLLTPPPPPLATRSYAMSLIFNLPNPPLSPPLLSTGFAVGASTLFTFTYVASLYLSPAGRLSAGKQDAQGNVMDRDHPVVMRARIKSASLATALTVIATGVGLWVKGVVPRAVSCPPTQKESRERVC